MMASVGTIIDRIKTPPTYNASWGRFWRRLWLVLGTFFAVGLVYEVVRWSRGRGEPEQIFFAAGFLSMSAFYLSRGGWARVAFFIAGLALLMTSFVMKFVYHP